MKQMTTLLVMTLVSSMAFSADGEKRNETRVRTLGESVLQVSSCPTPEVTATEFDEPMIKQDGTVSVDKDGNTRYVRMTRFTARTALNVSKCQSQEQYMVEVTGSFWNSKSSEVPGSAKQFGNLTTQTLSFSATKDVNLKKLMEASNGNSGWWDNSSAVALIKTFEQGVMNEAMTECQTKAQSLNRVAVPVSQTVCK